MISSKVDNMHRLIKPYSSFIDEFPEFSREFTLLALACSWNKNTNKYEIYACNRDYNYPENYIRDFFNFYNLFIESLLSESFEPKCFKFTFLLSDNNDYESYSNSYIINNIHINYPCFATTIENNMRDLSNIILIPDYAALCNQSHKYLNDNTDHKEKKLNFFWRGAVSHSDKSFTEEMLKSKIHNNQKLKFLINCRQSKNRDLLNCFYSLDDLSKLNADPSILPELENLNLFSSFTLRDEIWKNKFIFILEDCSTDLYQILSSNSCPIIVDDHKTWWYKHNLIEGEHYVSINQDLTDFDEKIEWCLNNLDKCEKIAENSKRIVQRIKFNSIIEKTSKLIHSALVENSWNFKIIYDFSDRKAHLDYKIQEEENSEKIVYVPSDSPFVPVSLGGWCAVAGIIRGELAINPIAYPFDYIRTTFEGIIHYIRTDFEGFFPTTGRCLAISGTKELVLCPGVYNAFYSYDPTNNETIKTFERRFKKFNDLLSSDKTIVFFRAMTSHLSETETSQIETFKETLRLKYPHLKYKLITIHHRGTDEDVNSIRLIKNLDNIYYWSVAAKYRYEHHFCLQYKRIIEYTMKCLNNNEEMLAGNEIHLNTLDVTTHTQLDFEYINHWSKDLWIKEAGYDE